MATITPYIATASQNITLKGKQKSLIIIVDYLVQKMMSMNAHPCIMVKMHINNRLAG